VTNTVNDIKLDVAEKPGGYGGVRDEPTSVLIYEAKSSLVRSLARPYILPKLLAPLPDAEMALSKQDVRNK
jgi:hypothetical protein